MESFCCYCGHMLLYPRRKTTEHLIPISKGGSNDRLNKADCCHRCNSWRGNKSLDYWEAEIKELLAEQGCKPPHYHRQDLEIMIENIDHIRQRIAALGL